MPAKNNTRKKSAQMQESVKYTNMFQAYGAFWRRGFTEWAGTSSPSEYWLTVLMNLLILFGFCVVFWVILIAENILYGRDMGIITLLMIILLVLFGLATIIPQISQKTRRLHDVGLSAWWWLLYLLAIIPIFSIIPGIFFFVVSLLPTKVADNPYHKYNK